jgi:hypothetical protein
MLLPMPLPHLQAPDYAATAAQHSPFVDYAAKDQTQVIEALTAGKVLPSWDRVLDPMVSREDMLGRTTTTSYPAPTVYGMDVADFEAATPSPSDAVFEANNVTRLTLLARKYADGPLTTEQSSRLAIVRERVRRLAPRVTDEDIATLSNIADEIAELSRESDAAIDELNALVKGR